MSAAVMEMLARRWHCSVPEVRDRIVRRLKAAGVVPDVPGDAIADDGRGYQRKIVLGVSDDDRIAVLDMHDHVILWLDDDPPSFTRFTVTD